MTNPRIWDTTGWMAGLVTAVVAMGAVDCGTQDASPRDMGLTEFVDNVEDASHAAVPADTGLTPREGVEREGNGNSRTATDRVAGPALLTFRKRGASFILASGMAITLSHHVGPLSVEQAGLPTGLGRQRNRRRSRPALLPI